MKQASRASVLAKPKTPNQYVQLNNNINEDENEVFLDSVEKRISALFHFIDKDNSGSIDRNELMLALLDLGIEKTWAEIDAMIKFADVDGDNEVDIDELVKAIMHEIREDGMSMPEEKKESDELTDDESSLVNGIVCPTSVTKPSSFIEVNNVLSSSPCNDQECRNQDKDEVDPNIFADKVGVEENKIADEVTLTEEFTGHDDERDNNTSTKENDSSVIGEEKKNEDKIQVDKREDNTVLKIVADEQVKSSPSFRGNGSKVITREDSSLSSLQDAPPIATASTKGKISLEPLQALPKIISE
jgi:calmodulin